MTQGMWRSGLAIGCSLLLLLGLAGCSPEPGQSASTTDTQAEITEAREQPETASPPASAPVAESTAPAIPSTADAKTVEPAADTAPDASHPASASTTAVDCPASATAAEACRVSKDIYVGWRSFHTHCFQCHGGSAMGSTFAPNLMERLATRVDHARFLEVMQKGYVGQMGAMPSFSKNSAVLKDQESLYAYLLARKDGLLPAGRPQRLPE